MDRIRDWNAVAGGEKKEGRNRVRPSFFNYPYFLKFPAYQGFSMESRSTSKIRVE